MIFKGKVAKEFIERRDERVAEDKRTTVDPYFQWDCEFPEWHQSKVDPYQTLHEHPYEWDTIHKFMGNIDYKLDSKYGVKVSDYIKGLVLEGKIQKFGVWRWLKKPHKILRLNDMVQYKILDYVDAKEAVKRLKHDGTFDSKGRKNMRFPFPFDDNPQDYDLDKALEEIRGTRMDQNYQFFRK